jgi:hypothetical protein
MIQKWVCEEFAPANADEVVAEAIDNAIDEVNDMMLEKFAPAVQNWIVEEYSPNIENWCIEEFAQGIQQWIVEEYAPEVENWMNESQLPKIQGKINEAVAESKKNSLNSIDETLKVLESLQDQKPTYSRKAIITENNLEEPQFIKEMPADARVKWDMASKEVKESIMRRAKLYNFVNENAIARFWENINFDHVAPTKNIYEGLEQVQDERERQIRMKLRSSRFARRA